VTGARGSSLRVMEAAIVSALRGKRETRRKPWEVSSGNANLPIGVFHHPIIRQLGGWRSQGRITYPMRAI